MNTPTLVLFPRFVAALTAAALILGTFATPFAQAAAVKEPTDPQHVPATKDDCKDGGWEQYGFSNQGLCIAWVNDHGQGGGGEGNGNGGGDNSTSTVTIVKYVDGVAATAANTDSASFAMQASWSDPVGIGTGSGGFNLNAAGSYMAVTSPLSEQADYATNEVLDGDTVGAACLEEGGPDFKLVGYTSGNTLAAAQAATPSATSPSFTDLEHNKWVIVWNETCEDENGGGGEDDTVNVIIAKYVDGAHATANSASSTVFNFIADYDATTDELGHIQGSDPYTIGPTGNLTPNAYEAKTLNFHKGADYGTHEVIDGDIVGQACLAQGGPDYALTGYSVGNTLAEAQGATKSMTAPNFDNLQADKYVIVWNDRCDNNGQGGGGEGDTSTVTIAKYVNGAQATAANASSTSFAMQSSWADPNGIGTGSGSFALNPAGSYQAVTSAMTTGEADYTANEVLDGTTVGAACMQAGGPMYRLVGYTSGNTLAAAQAATPTTTAPSLSNIDQDKYIIVWNEFCAQGNGQGGPGDNSTSTVTIHKYVNGAQATAANASSTSFAMQASWSDPSIGTSSGSFTLDPAGSYHAMTVGLTTGQGDYATNEVLGSTVGAACMAQGGPAYRLVGYTTGNTLAAAQAATPTTTSPSFVNIDQSKHVIVWNEFCPGSGQSTSSPTLTLVKQAIGGNGAFNVTLNGAGTTTLTTANGWATSSPIVLNVGSTTVAEVASAGWITNGISCMRGGQSIGLSNGTSSRTISVANGDNVTCTITNTSTTTDAALRVDSIDALKTTAIANNTYVDGWQYVFHITDPNSEENLSMRFSDWVGLNASNTIPVANNMRVSSAQASNPGPVTLTAANAYSTPAFIMTTDLNPSMPGRQVDVLVEVKIPVGTQNDTYTTTYGVQSLP